MFANNITEKTEKSALQFTEKEHFSLLYESKRRNTMATSHFCLSSSTYKNRVFEGFSRLQQSDEFVDMTLAAEGHLVKVHRTLIALASPFLKELLGSVPCQHPVLFLSNISHKILCYLLEFIYTGEVNIPSEDVRTFLHAAQAMHITGLENIIPPPMKKATTIKDMANHVFYKSRLSAAANTTKNIQNIVNESEGEYPTTHTSDKARSLDAAARNCFVKSDAENIPAATENTARDHEQAPHILHPGLPRARPFLTINTEFGINIQQNNQANIENHNRETVSLSTTANLPVSEQSGKFLSFMNVDTDTTKGDIEGSNTNHDIAQGPSNTEMVSNITNHDINRIPMIIEGPSNIEMVTNITNHDINRIPMIIEGHMSLYSQELLNNMGSEVTATVDCHNNGDNALSMDNAANNSQTNISSLLNISNNSLIQDQDMSVDISISDLLDCNHVATPSTTNETNEINESSAISKNLTIDLTDCDNVSSPNTENKMAEESVINKEHANEELDSNNVETSNTNNEKTTDEATDIVFLNQDQINAIISKEPESMLFSTSNRGSLHLIMNRFIYYCHYLRDKGRTRRWRCIDYRDLRCKATFDTRDEIILSRKIEHNHKNHDNKIYFKVMKHKIFPTLKMALEVCKRSNNMPEQLTDEDMSE